MVKCNRFFISLRHAFLITLVVIISASVAYSSEDIIEKARKLIEQQSRFDDAIVLLKKEVKKDPSDARAWYWLSIVSWKIKKFKETTQAMEKAFKLGLESSKHLTGYDTLGWVKYYSSDPRQSLTYFNKALKIKNDFINSVKGRGFVYILLNKPEKALLDLNFILERLPRNYDVLLKRGWANYLLGNYTQSITDFNSVISKDKNSFNKDEALVGRGWTFFFLTQFDKALADFNKAFPRIAPGDFKELKKGALIGKAFVLLGLKKYDQVLMLLEKADQPSDPRMGDMPETWSILRKKENSRRFWGEQSRKKAHIAAAHFIMGSKKEAIKSWGGPGRFGAYLKNYNKNGVAGVQILKEISPVGPALAAGLKPDDVIISLNNLPVKNSNSFLNNIVKQVPGKKVVLEIYRQDRKMKKGLVIGKAEEAIKNSILVNRLAISTEKIYTDEKSNPTLNTQSSESSKGGTDQDQNMHSQPIVEIENCEVEPSKVKMGEKFKTSIDIFFEDPLNEEKILTASFLFSIAKEGKILKKFNAETIKLKNGETVTLIKAIRAAKKKGTYQIYIEIKYKGITAKQKGDFNII